jgi:hypothetical protein
MRPPFHRNYVAPLLWTSPRILHSEAEELESEISGIHASQFDYLSAKIVQLSGGPRLAPELTAVTVSPVTNPPEVPAR